MRFFFLLFYCLLMGLIATTVWAQNTEAPPSDTEENNEILWYEDAQAARLEARETGKPLYFHLYYKYLVACKRMRFETFADERVRELLKDFVCCALDVTLPKNIEMTDKYANGVSKDSTGTTRFGALPANLFTDSQGEELYIRWGYIPSPGFEWILQNVIIVDNLRLKLMETHDDARANADLGAALMELELLQRCREPLQAAVKLDPDNKLGVFAEASLNLIVLEMPEDPAAAYTRLKRYLEQYPQGKNAIKARYFQAVTLYVQGGVDNFKAALEILNPLTLLKPEDAEYKNRWVTEAATLYVLIREELAGD